MTATLKLYEVADALFYVAEQLEENGGELTPDLAAHLEALEGAFETKVERVLLFMRNLDATAAGADAEAMRLAEIGKRKRAVAARLKEYLKAQMELARIPKIETPLVSVRIQKNSRPSISCTVPLELLPEGFIRISRAFDANAAYELWRVQAPLPAGIEVVVGTHLRIG
jgi:hypothetical protein